MSGRTEGLNKGLLEDDPVFEPVSWRWVILLTFCANSFCNSFSFMDFNTVPAVTKVLFGYCDNTENCDSSDGDSFVNNTYSAILFAVLPSFFPVLAYIGAHNWNTTVTGFTFQCIGGWLRWVCCLLAKGGHISAARTTCLASSACIGIGSAVVITSYSCLSQRWFAPEERTLATTIAVMSNYAGWCLGCVLIPYVVTTPDILSDMQMIQAFFVTAAWVALLICHREKPENAIKPEDGHEEASHSMLQELTALFSNQQYCLQCFCFSMLAGVSFSVPGFGTEALEDLNLTDTQSAWVNFAFVFSGVATGTALGKFCSHAEQFSKVMKGSFLATSLGLIGVILLIALQDTMDKDLVYGLLIIAMGVTGAASLGFIGIALSAAVETTYPVDAHFSGGCIEWLVQLWGGVFVFVSAKLSTGLESFMMVAIPTWICTVLVFTVYRQEVRSARSTSPRNSGLNV